MKENEPIYMYMDGDEFYDEFGYACDGNKLYPTLDALFEFNTSVFGVVKVKVELVKCLAHWEYENPPSKEETLETARKNDD